MVGGGKEEKDKGGRFKLGKKVVIENAVNFDRKVVTTTVDDDSRCSGSHRVFLLRRLYALYKFGDNISAPNKKLGQIMKVIGDTM